MSKSNKLAIGGCLIALVIGVLVGRFALQMPGDHEMASAKEDSTASDEPLYWVAPMDSNYRRDKPGKSPMGMDLVPVYAESKPDSEAGAVTVPAHVQHNMGVRLGTVQRATFRDSVSTFGRVEIAEDQMQVISPRIEGWIETLHVSSIGRAVVKGEVLFDIYSPVLVTAQEELLTALKFNNATLIESAEKRLQSLRVPNDLIERVKTSRKTEQTVRFRATQNGVVTSVVQREGSYVTPGTPVMSIAGLDPVWLVTEVFQHDIKGLATGNAVSVQLENGTKREASVDFVHPVLDENTRALKIRSILDNPDGSLHPNMFAKANIQLSETQPVLLVPTSALIRLADQDRVVVVLDDRTFKSVAVHVGRVGAEHAEIKHGLREGDQIVTSAQFLIDSESSKTSDFMRMNPMPSKEVHDHKGHSS